MTQVVPLDQILTALEQTDVVAEIAKGFIAKSQGRVIMPPIGELLFPEHQGEVHIKYGAIKGDEDFVIKIATGFFQNSNKNLPPFSGCMLVMSQKTGALKTVLLEEGNLTNHRTAAAGAVAAIHLAPKKVNQIAILGTGVQARLQAQYLSSHIDCDILGIWGRDPAKTEQAAKDITQMGYTVTIYPAPTPLCQTSQLVVTATPTTTPLITPEMINPGTHITAMGADTVEKCELAPDLLGQADLVVTDSLDQCQSRGEIHQALKQKTINLNQVIELGIIVAKQQIGRTNDNQITIADLTGIAAQDIMIATAISANLTPSF